MTASQAANQRRIAETMTARPNVGVPAALPRPVGGTHASSSPLGRAIALIGVLAELTKARLVSLVVVTSAVGYLMASGPAWSLSRLLWTMAGTALAAAGSMALNEWIEAERDGRMERTCRRPIPTGQISRPQALAVGVGIGATGLGLLAWRTTPTSALLGLAVVLVYVLVYTPLKPRTPLCTLAGAVCGALPPMMGWAAFDGSLGFGAWMLAGVLFLWQIPHFLALAWLYRDDYARGGFRMLPVVDRGGRTTVHVVTLYTMALLPVAIASSLAGLTGWVYASGSLLLGAVLLAMGVVLARERSAASARRLFLATLLYLPLLLGLMVADRTPRSTIRDARFSPHVDRHATMLLDASLDGPDRP
ncbi:MAG: heme o synthase [Acidobacteriota bacterium]